MIVVLKSMVSYFVLNTNSLIAWVLQIFFQINHKLPVGTSWIYIWFSQKDKTIIDKLKKF